MSTQDLWSVIGRAKTDMGFVTELMKNTPAALAQAGYNLSADEIQQMRSVLSGGGGAAGTASQMPVQEIYDTLKLQQAETQKRVVAQTDRMIDLNDFTSSMLKETIGHSAETYKKITMMNQVMFWMGITLFLFAVGYAVVTKNLVYSIAFAGLGTVSFIGFFFLGPIRQTQTALSNLISAEIAFMNFFEQMWLIERFASLPCREGSNVPDAARVERASEIMQQRSRQTIKLLHRFLAEKGEAQADAADADHAAAQAASHTAATTVMPPAGVPAGA